MCLSLILSSIRLLYLHRIEHNVYVVASVILNSTVSSSSYLVFFFFLPFLIFTAWIATLLYLPFNLLFTKCKRQQQPLCFIPPFYLYPSACKLHIPAPPPHLQNLPQHPLTFFLLYSILFTASLQIPYFLFRIPTSIPNTHNCTRIILTHFLRNNWQIFFGYFLSPTSTC